ncbi:MAG: hypothetical protein A3G74_02460 [Sulfurimonas sp. RIFCSPLOWO2_12_FULL_34_6]|nr:MAG: hypothetical protein A3G74_02460 [Sulfurimonas sp. RIFCSPLOWO2_12_FULL_34_6]
MIKFLIVFCFSLVLFAKEDANVYTVQLFSDNNIETAKRLLERVPPEFKSETHLYKVDGYYKARYFQSPSYSAIKLQASKIQKAGFKGAFAVKTTKLQMNKELIGDKKSEVITVKPMLTHVNKELEEKNKKEIPKKEIPRKNIQNNKPQLNKSDKLNKSDILQKAKSAYLKGDEGEALRYYEQALSKGFANEEARNNLCYLYGKQGTLSKAKEVIKGQRHKDKLIYSYAYGAVESNQKNYYNDMKEYIESDGNGKLTMLSGYYFEKNKDMQMAEELYKNAYEKNPTDVYNIYAYARLFDIKKNAQAVNIYKDILKSIDNTHPLYDTIVKRVADLE